LKKIYRYIKNKNLLLKSQHKNLDLLCYPKIETEIDYMRELSRILWYTHPFCGKIDKIIFLVNEALSENINNFSPPIYVDKIVVDYYSFIKDKIIFITDELQLKNQKIDIIFKWNKCESIPQIKSRFPYIVNASIYNNQFEANQMAKLSYSFLDTSLKLENSKRLKQYLRKLKDMKYKSINLFGSGPSINRYTQYTYDRSLSIVCNSIVKNKELLHTVQPKIIVATDAVFHAGYSIYAADFRNALCEAFDLLDELIFIVPLRDLMIYKSNLPVKYTKRIYGLEGKTINQFNFNLLEKLYTKSTSNVLTFFMIPLATTISKNINILGFDGKDTTIKDKFWNYDEKSQFTSIDYTKIAHPAFYNVDYDEYYSLHCAELKKMTNMFSFNGIKCTILAPSKIPALEMLR